MNFFHVVSEGTAPAKGFSTFRKRTFVRLLSCMNSHVYFEPIRSTKTFSTSFERTFESFHSECTPPIQPKEEIISRMGNPCFLFCLFVVFLIYFFFQIFLIICRTNSYKEQNWQRFNKTKHKKQNFCFWRL